MNRDQPYSEFLTTLVSLTNNFPTTQWYGFGSFFNGRGPFNDIDLLAVCVEKNEAVGIRKALSTLAAEWPIHLIVMTNDEATETSFVTRQKCCLLAVANLSVEKNLCVR